MGGRLSNVRCGADGMGCWLNGIESKKSALLTIKCADITSQNPFAFSWSVRMLSELKNMM
jgi:hypothetical protein